MHGRTDNYGAKWMTRIIAISDTHLEDEMLPDAVIKLAGNADIILHAGDFVSTQAYAALAELGRLEAVKETPTPPS